jgi:TetR/AcrR family transcriptional repressor of nem operon
MTDQAQFLPMPEPQPHPGRPRSFDEAEALDRVVRVFWTRGYPGTSYPELEAATGLHRQSLRYAFGDKASLFRRALAHYAEGRVRAVLGLLRRPGTAAANIGAVFDLWAADADPARPGCMMVNSLAEFGEARDAAGQALAAARRRLLDGLAAAFRAAVAEGSVRPDLAPEVLAAQALAMGDGLVLHGRSGGLGRDPAAVLRGFLAGLRPR